MKIGELAKAAATAVETIRYYEHEGLMPPPRRTVGNYRDYDEADLKRLGFIRQCRDLDMSLDEIREIIKHLDRPRTDDHQIVDQIVDQHIAHIVDRILSLRAMENTLREMRRQCGEDDIGCGVIDGLQARAAGAPGSPPANAGKKNHLH